MMKRTTGLLFAALLVCMAGTSLLAHEETFKGTVVSTKDAKLQIKVIDDKTKKESTMDFAITAKTNILRGDTVVTLAAARIQKEERIAVTVNHDVSMTDAVVIRLAAADAR
jgi:hypothetical protein